MYQNIMNCCCMHVEACPKCLNRDFFQDFPFVTDRSLSFQTYTSNMSEKILGKILLFDYSHQRTNVGNITFYNDEKMNEHTVVHNLFLPQKSFPWANRAFFPPPYKRTAAFKIQKKKVVGTRLDRQKRIFYFIFQILKDIVSG